MYQNRQSLAKLSDTYSHLSPAQKAEIKLLALALERMRGPREAQEWVCHYGTAATRWAMAQGAVSNSTTPNDSGAKSIAVDTAAYQPKFISDEKWTEKRMDIMNRSLAAIKTLMSASTSSNTNNK
jgi:hypothetical protein